MDYVLGNASWTRVILAGESQSEKADKIVIVREGRVPDGFKYMAFYSLQNVQIYKQTDILNKRLTGNRLS